LVPYLLHIADFFRVRLFSATAMAETPNTGALLGFGVRALGFWLAGWVPPLAVSVPMAPTQRSVPSISVNLQVSTVTYSGSMHFLTVFATALLCLLIGTSPFVRGATWYVDMSGGSGLPCGSTVGNPCNSIGLITPAAGDTIQLRGQTSTGTNENFDISTSPWNVNLSFVGVNNPTLTLNSRVATAQATFMVRLSRDSFASPFC
jgi:hypothetical protein